MCRYPVNESFIREEVTYLSYQTLTIDLYAPLLLLILLFSLMFTLLSCSCSRLSDRYRLATMYAKPSYEVSGENIQDPTTILARSFPSLNGDNILQIPFYHAGMTSS